MCVIYVAFVLGTWNGGMAMAELLGLCGDFTP